nr:reverse transcriptase domain, viral movement protein [Tanacetum cinerariifolium]
MINPISHVLPIQKDPPLPLAKIHLLTDAYAKPILVIAFFDTGSSVSILNPNILPDHYWKPHHQNFMATNGEKFVINKISVPINIRLFPKCVIKRRLLGSSSHGKDLLIGFDILHKLPNLRWTNVNPTKASHPGMNPDHYQLAKEECEQLVSQGIIEPTASPWACEAFYVNKRSEQKKSLFQHLADAKVLSKFDLKSGFWQLDNPDAYKWIEANGQWLYDNFDHCEVETSDDDDDARSLWSSDDDEHFDPFEDDPTHPDARWNP